MIRLELPLVPSLNNAYASVGAKRVPSREHVAWKREAGWLVKLAKPEPIAGPYRLTVLVPVAMRGDCSNRIKLAEDLLVELGVTPDDRHAVSAACRRDRDVAPGRCAIIVEAA